MESIALLPLYGALAIVLLFAGYGCYEWGRIVLGKAKAGWNADTCRTRFAIPAVICSLLPCFAVVLCQKLGLVNLNDGSLKIMLAMIGAMALGFVFLLIVFGVFSFKLNKSLKG
jgi:hypothetical protein